MPVASLWAANAIDSVAFPLAGATGCGDFALDTNAPFGRTERGYALGDFDGDGDLDAVGFSGDTLYYHVFQNDGSGTFTRQPQQLGKSTSSSTLAAIKPGDLNNDNHLDLFFAYTGSLACDVYLNNGDGTFTSVVTSTGTGCQDAELGDLDGDGDLDVFISRYTNPVYLNDGTGHFTVLAQNLLMSDSGGLSLGDLDGDGDLDVVVACRATYYQSLEIRLNDGQGHFTHKYALGNEYTPDCALGDLDGDGDLDIFAVTSDGPQICLNDGQANFLSKSHYPVYTDAYSVALGDLDGDGDLDAWVGNGEPSSIGDDRVWINDGRAYFTPRTPGFSSFTWTFNVVLGDVNGDDALDALTDSTGLWLNSQGPYVGTNVVFRVVQYRSAIITNQRLAVTCSRQGDPDQIIFTVTDLPDHGSLQLNGTPIAPNGTFSQDDVDHNRLSYANNGDAVTNDKFTFTVNDGFATAGPSDFRFFVGLDTDRDGVPDGLEGDNPMGDANRDGISDALQANVATVPAGAPSYAWISLVAPTGTRLNNIQPHPADAFGSLPPGFSCPVGFIAFTVEDVTPGATIAVEMVIGPYYLSYYGNISAFLKYGPTSANPADHWYEFTDDGTTGAIIESGRIILRMTDGGRGDSDLTQDGQITDPGAPAINSNPPPTSATCWELYR